LLLIYLTLIREDDKKGTNPDGDQLTAKDLLKWCVQIANALSHLDGKKVLTDKIIFNIAM